MPISVVDTRPASCNVGPIASRSVACRVFRNLRPLGAWVKDASFAELDDEAVVVFTADDPHPDALAVAEVTCWRCPVRQQCADHACDGLLGGGLA